MKAKNFKAAVAEAKRFLEVAERVEKDGFRTLGSEALLHWGANAAALRRSSLDLSKSLATLRKSDY